MSIPRFTLSELFTVLLLWLPGFPGNVGSNVVLQVGRVGPKDCRKQKDVILRDLAPLQPSKYCWWMKDMLLQKSLGLFA